MHTHYSDPGHDADSDDGVPDDDPPSIWEATVNALWTPPEPKDGGNNDTADD